MCDVEQNVYDAKMEYNGKLTTTDSINKDVDCRVQSVQMFRE